VGTRSVEASEILSARLDRARVVHSVLNARQDSEEADVVAKAGFLDSITVATNMAGRGTDIQIDQSVIDRGGLHVIATDRHEARRIDRQLFGRCGRQGDPGSCESFVSLEDDLFETHATALAKRIAEKTVDSRSLVLRAAVKAVLNQSQRAVEGQHSRMRRQLIRQDQQLDSLLGFSGRPY
jgi:preprotein translocase subunit SecA